MKTENGCKIFIGTLIMVCLFFSGCDIKIKRETIQKALAKKFPFEKDIPLEEIGLDQVGVIKCRLKRPEVILENGTDKIGGKIWVEAYLNLALDQKIKPIKEILNLLKLDLKIDSISEPINLLNRDFAFKSKVDYNRENHSFHLSKPDIVGLDEAGFLNSIPLIEKHRKKALLKVKELIWKKIYEIPVYKIKKDSFKKRMLRERLDKIKVEKENIVITFSKKKKKD